jgi:WD40 repeat protein
MSILLTCQCGHRMKVPDALAGRQILCDSCWAPLSIGGIRRSAEKPQEGEARPKGKKKRKKATVAAAATPWPWVVGGTGAVVLLALGVVGLVWLLNRGGEPAAIVHQAMPPTRPTGPVAVQPAVAAEVTTKAAKALPPAPVAPLSEADKRLQGMFKCQVVLFGPARFDDEAFRGRPLTGVVAEVEGLVPGAIGRFEAATVVARMTRGADLPAAIVFTAGGRDGLAGTANILPGSVGIAGDISLGAERFRPWPVGSFGMTLRRANTPNAVTGHVHVAPGQKEFNVGDFLLAVPLVLEPRGGVEYGFIPGKKVRLGFLFPVSPQELTHVKLLGSTLPLDAGKQAGSQTVAKGQPGPEPKPADVPPPGAGAEIAPGRVLEVFATIKTPIKERVFGGTRGQFVPQHVIFAPDGGEFAGVGNQARACWSREGVLHWGDGDHGSTSAGYSADGKRVFFFEEGRLTIHDRVSGKRISECDLGRPPQAPQPGFPFRPVLPAQTAVEVLPGAVIAPTGKTAFAPTRLAQMAPFKGQDNNTAVTVRAYETLRGKEILAFAVKHARPITCLALSPDGKRLVTGSEDHTIRLWNTTTGKQVRDFQGHQATIHCLAWSGDGKRIVSSAGDIDVKLSMKLMREGKSNAPALTDYSVRVWDADTGGELFRLGGVPGHFTAALSPDGRFVAHRHAIWEVGRAIPRYVCPTREYHLMAFAPDGGLVVAAAAISGDDHLALLRFPEAAAVVKPKVVAESPAGPEPLQATIHNLEGHEDEVIAVRLLPDKKSAFSIAADHTLRLWDLKERKAKKVLPIARRPFHVAFSPSGQSAAIDWMTKDEQANFFHSGLELLSLETGKAIRTWPTVASIMDLSFSSDGRRLFSADTGGVGVWDTGRGKALWHSPLLGGFAAAAPHQGHVLRVLPVPGGKRVLSGGQDHMVKLWDMTTGAVLATLSGHKEPITSLALSSDGKSLLSGSKDQTLILWDLAKGKEMRTFTGHTGAILCGIFQTARHQIVSVADNGEVIVWDARTGAPLRRLEGDASQVTAATISVDGRMVLLGSMSGTLRLVALSAEK